MRSILTPVSPLRLMAQTRLRSLLATVLLCGAGCREKTATERGPAAAARTMASACRSDSLEQALRTTLFRMHERNRVPGISAAVFAPASGSLVTATVGVTSLESGRALLPSDRFLAGSVGKTFFAALALRAASRGELPLDTPVSSRLPQARVPAFAWITPRMLLSHTSGIGEYDAVFMTALVREPLRVRVRDDWLSVLQRTPPKREDAGRFRYSDLNYVVLALLLDATYPQGAYDAIDRAFLTPLGLTATAPSITPAIRNLVTGYDGAGSMFGRDAMVSNGALVYNPQFEWGGGGFVSTPSDLARWLAAFRGGQAFPDTLWAAVVARPAGVADSAREWRGMGVHVGPGTLGAHVGHSGYMPGYVSWVRWYDSLGLSISIQANASDTLRLPDDGFAWVDTIAGRIGVRCR